ncbi:hypothetical protein T11_4984 [Trichinella zimbabwensis]|uniref:Uncharacterized protein n=1 Tax=Trichinella zimbabwensis TaxID=268475 RepID=A0A0V1GQC3_9BILA|nr:hypothetical protein T11_4984 [Trichinella zimbabwensis]
MKPSDLYFVWVHKSVNHPPVQYEQPDVSTALPIPTNWALAEHCNAQVLKLPYQPTVEYEQADVSTANLPFHFSIIS